MLAFVLIATINIICHGYPTKDDSAMLVPGNLKHTFQDGEEIPAAFLDQSSRREERKGYAACQDGSGGMCIPKGKCPPDLTPTTNTTSACPTQLECCFGPPVDDTACSSGGGSCVPRASCGHAPIIRTATDCNTSRGEVCCVFVI